MDILQPFLGQDKSNPLFEILLDPKIPDLLFVYFGMRLLEKIRRNSLEEKFLVGRLFNANFSRRELTKNFGYDFKTMRKWGEALHTGDIEPDFTTVFRKWGLNQFIPLNFIGLTCALHNFL